MIETHDVAKKRSFSLLSCENKLDVPHLSDDERQDFLVMALGMAETVFQVVGINSTKIIPWQLVHESNDITMYQLDQCRGRDPDSSTMTTPCNVFANCCLTGVDFEGVLQSFLVTDSTPRYQEWMRHTSHDFLDGYVLYTIVPTTVDHPYRSVCIKWASYKTEGPYPEDKDFVLLEYTDLVTKEDGEQVAFSLIESVHVAGLLCRNEPRLVRGQMPIAANIYTPSKNPNECYLQVVSSSAKWERWPEWAAHSAHLEKFIHDAITYVKTKGKMMEVFFASTSMEEVVLANNNQNHSCYKCHESFSLVRHMHACASCRQLVCTQCTSLVKASTPLSEVRRIRLCNTCLNTLSADDINLLTLMPIDSRYMNEDGSKDSLRNAQRTSRTCRMDDCRNAFESLHKKIARPPKLATRPRTSSARTTTHKQKVFNTNQAQLTARKHGGNVLDLTETLGTLMDRTSLTASASASASSRSSDMHLENMESNQPAMDENFENMWSNFARVSNETIERVPESMTTSQHCHRMEQMLQQVQEKVQKISESAHKLGVSTPSLTDASEPPPHATLFTSKHQVEDVFASTHHPWDFEKDDTESEGSVDLSVAMEKAQRIMQAAWHANNLAKEARACLERSQTEIHPSYSYSCSDGVEESCRLRKYGSFQADAASDYFSCKPRKVSQVKDGVTLYRGIEDLNGFASPSHEAFTTFSSRSGMERMPSNQDEHGDASPHAQTFSKLANSRHDSFELIDSQDVKDKKRAEEKRQITRLQVSGILDIPLEVGPTVENISEHVKRKTSLEQRKLHLAEEKFHSSKVQRVKELNLDDPHANRSISMSNNSVHEKAVGHQDEDMVYPSSSKVVYQPVEKQKRCCFSFF